MVTIKKGMHNYFQVPFVNTNVGVIAYIKLTILLQVKQSTILKSPPVNKTTVTPPDQILEKPSLTLLNKISSENQQRLLNIIDLSGLTTSDKESKGHAKKRV